MTSPTNQTDRRNAETTGEAAPRASVAGNTVPPHERERLEREFAAYRRELPRLLQEGHAGRYVLLKDGEVVSVWDTFRDASQAGYERFGAEGKFSISKINPQDVERFALLDAGKVRDLRKEASCPS